MTNINLAGVDGEIQSTGNRSINRDERNTGNSSPTAGTHAGLHDCSPFWGESACCHQPNVGHIHLPLTLDAACSHLRWLSPTAGTYTCMTAHLGCNLQPAALQRAPIASDLVLFFFLQDKGHVLKAPSCNRRADAGHSDTTLTWAINSAGG